jgi:transcription initiation factor TFIIIB Brf1 subunit/transcription initiation factor TFIIB
MSDFNLFNEAINLQKLVYNQEINQELNLGFNQDCKHSNIITEKGVNICIDCGEEISQKLTFDKEWRYFPNSDSKTISESNLKKDDDRNILKDLENLGFSESIKIEANNIYVSVTSQNNKNLNQKTRGKILRGNSRKGIIFACTYQAFKLANMPQSHESLLEIFNLQRKDGLRGLKYVNLHAPKDSKIRTTYVTPIALLNDIMSKFSANEEQKKEVIALYEKIRNKSSPLNRSRPQSVASGLVYYWICLKKKDISLRDFAKKVSLSELTISKISKIIAEII